jgi:hypothetical protein
MPLYAAQKALNDDDISPEELFACIGQTNIEIGNLYCRCHADPQLTSDLLELEKIQVELTEKYQKLLNNQKAIS